MFYTTKILLAEPNYCRLGKYYYIPKRDRNKGCFDKMLFSFSDLVQEYKSILLEPLYYQLDLEKCYPESYTVTEKKIILDIYETCLNRKIV
jgi:hypothetical protein